MKLTSKELIKEFYEKNKDKYPNMTYNQMESVISTPYKYLKEEIESTRLSRIRLKYLGVFQVYRGSAVYHLDLLLKNEAKGIKNLGKVRYEKLTVALKSYIEKTRTKYHKD